MEQTSNYQLNQWAESDRILRTDFNSDNAKIEAALADLTEAVAGCGNCKIEYGSYTGTGGYDSAHPNSLTFSGQPLLVLIQCGDSVGTLLMVRGTTKAFYSTNINEATSAVSVNWGSANTLTWYASSAQCQMNRNLSTYHYIALLAADN